MKCKGKTIVHYEATVSKTKNPTDKNKNLKAMNSLLSKGTPYVAKKQWLALVICILYVNPSIMDERALVKKSPLHGPWGGEGINLDEHNLSSIEHKTWHEDFDWLC